MKTKIKFLAMMLMGIVLSTNVWGGLVTETLTQSKITTNVTNSACAYATEKTYTDGNVSYSFYVYADATRPWMQLKKDKGVYIKISTPDPITQVDVTITSTSNSSGGVADISMHTAYSGRLALLLTDAAGSADMTGVASTNEISNNVMTLTPTGSNTELYLKVSIGARVWQIAVTHGSSCTETLATPVVTATPGNGSATLTWATVANATKYQVSWNDGAYTDATSPYEKTGLTNDQNYTWKVKAIGGGDHCDSEDATGNVTPSANHTVTWYVDGFVYTTGSPTTEVVHNGKVTTLPAQPDVPTACAGSVFVGWTDRTVTNGNKPSPLFKDAASAPTVNADVSYHAVFAEPE